MKRKLHKKAVEEPSVPKNIYHLCSGCIYSHCVIHDGLLPKVLKRPTSKPLFQHLKSGDNLVSDPYVKVEVILGKRKPKKKKTSVKRNTLNPYFNESMTFDKINRNQIEVRTRSITAQTITVYTGRSNICTAYFRTAWRAVDVSCVCLMRCRISPNIFDTVARSTVVPVTSQLLLIRLPP